MDASAKFGDITYRGCVREDWLDHNDHMNLGYFLVAFDLATGEIFRKLEIGEHGISRHGETDFAVETHVTYRHEMRRDEECSVRTALLGHDHNKLHFMHAMFRPGLDDPVAFNEVLTLHVDMRSRKAVPFRPETLAALAAIADDHRRLVLQEEYIGRAVLRVGWPVDNPARPMKKGDQR